MLARNGKAVRQAAAAVALILLAVSGDGAVIKDLARVYGPMENPVVGLGLVVGLAGTGDDAKFAPEAKLLSTMLTNLDAGTLPVEVKFAKNAAVVTVSATLPAFARVGDRLDVEVSALGNAKSLAGGQLIVSRLGVPHAVTGEFVMYAIASGNLKVDEAHPTRGAVARGAIVQRAVPTELTPQNKVTFKLLEQNADYSVATRIVNAIHQDLNIDPSTGAKPVAKAVDAATIEVTLTEAQLANPVAFISRLERLTVPTLNYVMEARVVVDEKNGKFYAINGNVEISPVDVGYGNIQIQIRPAQGEEAVTLDTLVEALKELKATTEDVIEILKALEYSGALHAKVYRR